MSLFQLAWRNVRHQARNYAAFFLSSTFAVWMFFLYGSLLFHPQLNLGALPETSQEILLFVEGVVAFFSVFFIRYAHSTFLKARTREIATLSLLGMLPRQLARMVRYEHLTIGLGAITAGVLLGLAFLKLFLLGMSRVLRLSEPVEFAISWAAIGVTYGVFLLIFLVITLLSQWSLRRLSVAEAFREAVRPKEPPRFAWWKVLLCLLCLGPAYVMLLGAEGHNIGDRILPILLMVTVGTYLLLTQGSVAILRGLQRRPEIYTRRTNLLTISQLVYKMRDNARILFMVSMLSTFSLVAIGLFYSAWSVSAEQAEEFYPVGLRIHGEPGGITPERVEEVLARHKVEVTASAHIPRVARSTLFRQGAEMLYLIQGPMVMPASAVNAWLVQLGRDPIALGEGGGAMLTSSSRGWAQHEGQVMSLSPEPLGPPGGRRGVPEELLSFRLERLMPMPPLNQVEVLVLADPLFERLARSAPVDLSHLWQFNDWRSSLAAVSELYEAYQATLSDNLPNWSPGTLAATALADDSFQRANGFGLFLCAFVAALFFLGSGNMLYFKLFTDLYDDKRHFQALDKVGILPAEVQRVVSTQTFLLFFVPLGLAILNATVALRLATRVFAIPLWEPLAITAGGFTLLYLLYFLITRRTYVGALMERH